jgi:predicted nucleic acid-binding protein
VKVFFDTSVLIPVFVERHVHHEASFRAFVGVAKGQGFCAGHSLAELYSVASRLPGSDRLSTEQILLIVESLRERLTIVTLSADDYFEVIERVAASGLVGGLIYDALLVHCALKAEVQTIYTWNVKHFEQLGPDIARRLRTP